MELRSHHDTLLKVIDARELLQDMSNQLNGRETNEKFVSCLRTASQKGAAFLKEIRQPLEATSYPFDHTEGRVSVGRYLLPELPPWENLGAVHTVLSHTMMEGLRLSTRIVSRLCVIVEQIETSLGLPLGEKPQPKVSNE